MRLQFAPKISHMLSLSLACLSLSLSLAPAASAAPAIPAPNNSLELTLEKSCSDRNEPCIEGYKVRFREVSFQKSKHQATIFATLLPNASIDYPILTDTYEGQLTQASFTAVCKLPNIDGVGSVMIGDAGYEVIQGEFKAALGSCLRALADRTEKALGRLD